MNATIKRTRYTDFLKYHLVIMALPVITGAVFFLKEIIELLYDIFRMYSMLFDSDQRSFLFIFTVIKKVLQLAVGGIIYKFICTIIDGGLYFLPYLSVSQERIQMRSILKRGIAKLIPIFFITTAGTLIIGIVNSTLFFIPLLNVTVIFVLPISVAALYILYSYAFSINMLQSKPLSHNIHLHFRELFIKDKKFILYACILALSSFVMGSIFVKPYIQMRIAERLIINKNQTTYVQNHEKKVLSV